MLHLNKAINQIFILIRCFWLVQAKLKETIDKIILIMNTGVIDSCA